MKGIFYLTFNGVVNNTNGIGTQTKLLLDGFDFFYDKLIEQYGDISLNIITPDYPANYEGYSKDHVNFSKEKINKLGGNIFFCKDSKTYSVCFSISSGAIAFHSLSWAICHVTKTIFLAFVKSTSSQCEYEAIFTAAPFGINCFFIDNN